MNRRILFVTRHCYLDDSNGAAVSSREVINLLTGQGFNVEVLSSTMLDLAIEIDPISWLAGRGWNVEAMADQFSWALDARGIHAASPPHLRLEAYGVPVTLHLGPSTRPHVPDDTECAEFLSLFETVANRLQPDVVVGYGGDRVQRRIFADARSHGVATVFLLHNCKYKSLHAFAGIDGIVAPSHYAAQYYRDTLGLDVTVLPHPVDRERIRVKDSEPRYVTFVNPTVEKGVFAFVRIADELGRRRPDIPLLVVESLGTEAIVVGCGIDLRTNLNVHIMNHTPDPRQFYRVSRAVLMPSLVPETFGRVAAEAMCNGIPVLASDRGALPETLGDSGILLPLPTRLTPAMRTLPTAEEVEPWIEAIIRLWDDAGFAEDLHRRALYEAERWTVNRLIMQYVDYFVNINK